MLPLKRQTIVLMTDEPTKLVEAIAIARKTKRIVWQNIAFALGVKGIILLFGAFGIATMWESGFCRCGRITDCNS